MTRHAYASAIITMSLRKFNSLPGNVQKIFLDAAQEAAVFERKWVADNESRQMADLEANGMEVIREPDLGSFRTAAASVYQKYNSQYGDYLKQINTALGR
jgi:TRAP-type C4-dicarboxylate transport system substrate-binding protein